MQNSNSFDLDRAIHDWRVGLADSPAFKASNLHELESHLRDSIHRLRSSHLSEEDCFVLATHRLGSPVQLTVEFSKVNRRSIWLERVMWMLAGSLLLGFVTSVSTSVARIIILMTPTSLMNGNWLSGLAAALAPILFVLGILFVWRMLLRPPALFRAVLHALFRNRAVAILALLLMTSLSGLISYYSVRQIISTRGNGTMERFAMAQIWSAWAMTVASSLFIIITFVCLAQRHLNSSSRPTS